MSSAHWGSRPSRARARSMDRGPQGPRSSSPATVGQIAQTSWRHSHLRALIVLAVVAKVTGLIVLFDFSGHALHPFDLVKSLYSRAFEWILVALLIAAVLSWGIR